MYSGYAAAALALRAKPLVPYSPLPLSADDGCELVQNPLCLLFNGYFLRQSAVLYWAPSRSFAACRQWAVLSGGLCPAPCATRTSLRSLRKAIGFSSEAGGCRCRRFCCQRLDRRACYRELGQSGSICEDDPPGYRSCTSNRGERRGGSCSECGSELWSQGKEGRGRRLVEREVRAVWEYDEDDRARRRYLSESDKQLESRGTSKFSGRAYRRDEGAGFRACGCGPRDEYDHDSEEDQIVRRRERNEGSWSRDFPGASDLHHDDGQSEYRKKNEVGVRKVRWSKDDRRLQQAESSNDSEEETASLTYSDGEVGQEYNHEKQNCVRIRCSQDGSQRCRTTFVEQENDVRRASGPRRLVDATKVRKEEGSASRTRWRDTIDQHGEREKYASTKDMAQKKRDNYVEEDDRYARRADLTDGYRNVRVISKDDSNWSSSFKKNVSVASASRQNSKFDQKIVGHTESAKMLPKIMEKSRVHDTNIERESQSVRETRSTPVQNSLRSTRDERSRKTETAIPRTETTKDKDFSSARALDSASPTARTETAVIGKPRKSLWHYVADIIRVGYVADIIRVGWLPRDESQNSAKSSGNIALSSDSDSGEAWFSGEDYDEDETENRGQCRTSEGQFLIRKHVGEPSSIAPSVTRQVSAQQIGNRTVSEAGVPASLDIAKEGFVAKASATLPKTEAGERTDSQNVNMSAPSSALIVDQPLLMIDSTPSVASVEKRENKSNQIPASGNTVSNEKVVVDEVPEIIRTEGIDVELKRRKLQRNKHVLQETFDEWEEAHKHDSEQRKLDEFFMREALVEAQRAADSWEVPVGAVLVRNGEIIARGCNLVEELRDSTAHAEMICIREASNHLQTWRLAETTLYVTLEPCPMCAGAILQSRIDTVVWGAPNKLVGADGSWVRLFPGDGEHSSLDPPDRTAGPVHPFHPSITVRRGVLAAECSEIMKQFFHLRKNNKPEQPPPLRLPLRTYPIKFFTKMHMFFCPIFCL